MSINVSSALVSGFAVIICQREICFKFYFFATIGKQKQLQKCQSSYLKSAFQYIIGHGPLVLEGTTEPTGDPTT